MYICIRSKCTKLRSVWLYLVNKLVWCQVVESLVHKSIENMDYCSSNICPESEWKIFGMQNTSHCFNDDSIAPLYISILFRCIWCWDFVLDPSPCCVLLKIFTRELASMISRTVLMRFTWTFISRRISFSTDWNLVSASYLWARKYIHIYPLASSFTSMQ